MSEPLRLRIEPGEAGESWKRSEGCTVSDKFPLRTYLAGSDDSAVFLTSIPDASEDSKAAIIKLMYAVAADADKQLQQWASARQLTHLNLLHIFDAGSCDIEGMHLLYVVEEYADENLAQILPDRPLTSEEVRELLPPVLGALQYLHEQGLAHGRLQPSNILAVGNLVKLSSDTLLRVGQKTHPRRSSTIYDPPEAAPLKPSPASDVWQLGVTLIEVLTQHPPSWDRVRSKSLEIPRSMPEPFREIAIHCLQVEPEKRCTIAQIQSRLATEPSASKVSESAVPTLSLVHSEAADAEIDRSEKTIPSTRPSIQAITATSAQQPSSARWPYFLALAAVIALVILLLARPKRPAPSTVAQSAPALQSPATESPASASPQAPPALAPPASTPAPATVNNEGITHEADQILHRVVPDVSSAAQRTIHGRIVVRVRIRVDGAGNVEKATLQSGRVSKYFSRLALRSAEDWKFSPKPTAQPGDRQWNLQFAFTRSKTEASAAPVNR
jgi:TonB family protein